MTSASERSAVLLDKHPLWLDAVESVLARVGVHVVAKTTSSSDALALVGEHTPDLFVTGIEIQDGEPDGISCLRRVCAQVPTMRAIVLSSHEEPEYVEAALDAGALAYVVKTTHPDDLAAAVRQTFEHSIYLAGSPAPTVTPSTPPVDEGVKLTRREIEILKLVGEGHSNAELARMLWVTEQTVKFHLTNIYRKLGVSNRTEASRWAQVHALLDGAEATNGRPPSGTNGHPSGAAVAPARRR